MRKKLTLFLILPLLVSTVYSVQIFKSVTAPVREANTTLPVGALRVTNGPSANQNAGTYSLQDTFSTQKSTSGLHEGNSQLTGSL